MALQSIGLGVAPSGAGGDSARTAFEKMNANFSNPAHAASKLVQTSPTDTTAGALMAVGAFGLGAHAVTLSAPNLNDERPTGFYYCNSATNSPGVGNGWLLHEDLSAAGYAAQTYKAVIGARVFTRLQNNGAWSAWVEAFNTGNILGAVSQSGGVPTGAIIERGSNANGEYVRFADGTQICLCSPAALLVTSVAAGAGFQGSNFTTFTYPAAFVVAPHPLFSTSYGGSGSRGWASIGSLTTTTVGLIAHSFSNDGNVVARPVLVGRWY